MNRSSLGKISLVFTGITVVIFILHFCNVIPGLNTVIAPLFAFLGTLVGVIGYFERDKQKVQAFIGMLVNAALLILWIVLFIVSVA
jgi:hypothetical protein